MDDQTSVDAENKACMLVGRFLQSWALVESQINRVIGSALGLKNLQAIIIYHNTQLRDKIHIARTLVHMSSIGREKAEFYDKLLISIGNFAIHRHTAAHNMFMAPEKGDGVEFMIVKAKGQLKFPDVIWSEKDIDEKQNKCMLFCRDLRKLENDLEQSRIADEVLNFEPPKYGIFGKGFPSPPAPHSQLTLSSLLEATHLQDDENHQDQLD